MKIAIVGSHPNLWQAAPFDDKAWTIWGFSRKNFNKLPRFDQWFELHDKKLFPSYENAVPGYSDWMKTVGAVTQQDFPLVRILSEFGPYFFTGGQLSWLMAHAVMQKPEVIGLWGIEGAGEYKPQRLEIQHFASMGIPVIAPGTDLLAPNKLYAFS